MSYRWIMYTMQHMPGNVFSDLKRVDSLSEAVAEYDYFCKAVGTDDCSSTLYAYSEEAWESAEEFRNSGCPFDYPDRIIERGPNGGIRVNNT